MQSIIKKFFYYPKVDVQRGIIALLCAVISLFVSSYFHFNIAITINFVVTASIAPLLIAGPDKKQQSSLLFVGGIIATISQILLLWVFYHLAGEPHFIYPVMGALIFLLLCIPRIYPPLSTICMIVAAFNVLLVGFPHDSTYITSQDLYSSIAIAAGLYLVMTVNLCFPTRDVPLVPVDKTNYFYKRNVRVAIAVALGMYLATITHLQHAAWLGLTVLVVSRNNLGASIHVAVQRLVGTFLAVALGIPAAYYLFMPYPRSRWVVMIFLFCGMTIVKKYYDLGIFLLTFILAAVYLYILPDPHQIFMTIGDRLFETALGVVFAIMSEIILFPQSILNLLRRQMQGAWKHISSLHAGLDESDATALQQYFTGINTQQELILADYKYECFGFMSKRYQLLERYLQEFSEYDKGIVEVAQFNTAAIAENLGYHVAAATQMESMFALNNADRITGIKKLAAELSIKFASINTTEELQQINQQLLSLLNAVVLILETPWYTLK